MIKAAPSRMEDTVGLLEFQLFLVSPTGGSSVGVPPDRRVDLRGVDALSHVVSGQTRRNRAGAKVCSAIEQ